MDCIEKKRHFDKSLSFVRFHSWPCGVGMRRTADPARAFAGLHPSHVHNYGKHHSLVQYHNMTLSHIKSRCIIFAWCMTSQPADILNAFTDESTSEAGITLCVRVHYCSELTGDPCSDCKEPGFDSGWPAVLHCQHHRDSPLPQIHSQKQQEDMTILHPEDGACSGPGPRLLQPAPGRSACMCPLQLIHDAATQLVPLRTLCWLLVTAQMRFKVLVLAKHALIISSCSALKQFSIFHDTDVAAWFLQFLGYCMSLWTKVSWMRCNHFMII